MQKHIARLYSEEIQQKKININIVKDKMATDSKLLMFAKGKPQKVILKKIYDRVRAFYRQ